MRKLTKLCLSAIIPLFMLAGCAKEEIVFPIEEQQFEVRDGYILIEVIAPNETSISSDVLYITGEFSNNKRLELTRAEYMDYKYGIYLNPEEFAEGKTLADGYTFVSNLSGKEMTGKDEPAMHYQNAQTGGRIDLTLSHWEMFYSAHNGYVMYVDDQTTWGRTLYLYAWSDTEPEIFGAWPGVPATGSEEIDGINYTYFDMLGDNNGKTYNFILNDGGNGNQKDAINGFTINRDIYLTLTDDGCKEKGAAVGRRIYALNHTGWLDLRLYVWGDGEFMGGWPGSKPVGSQQEIAGNNYDVFEFPADANNKTVNLIFNNTSDKTKPESISLKLDRDYYIQVVIEGGPKIIDPEGEIVKPDLPEGDMIIRANKPASWTNLYIQAGNYTNSWPGSLMEDDGDGWYSFSLPRGVPFVFVEAPIGNQTEVITNIKDDACFKIQDNGICQKVSCE